MNRHSILTYVTAIAAAVSVPVSAADQPQFPAPQKEHQWLQQLVGEWDLVSEASAGPGEPAMRCEGHESVKSLGGFWIVSNLRSKASDAEGNVQFDALLTVGFDPSRQRYVGTWQDSMSSYLWKYEGHVDATGKILTLEAEGPNPMLGGKMCKFRDITEFKSADHRVMRSEIQSEDGQWVTFMTGEARRSPAHPSDR